MDTTSTEPFLAPLMEEETAEALAKDLEHTLNEANEVLNKPLTDTNAVVRLAREQIKLLQLDLKHFKHAIDSWLEAIPKLEKHKAEEKRAHKEKWCIWTKADPEKRNTARVERKVERCIARLEAFIESVQELNSPVPKVENISTDVRLSRSETHVSPRLPALPTPTLPAFAGKPGEFGAWWEQYNELVHDRDDISRIEKMSYLRQSLRETAKLTLDQFPCTSAAYDDAIALLKDCFSSKKGDDRAVLTELENIVPSSDGWQDLLHMTLSLKACMSRMGRMHTEAQEDIVLQQLLLKKFPNFIREKLYRQVYNAERATVRLILDNAENMIKEELFLMNMGSNTSKMQKSILRHSVNVANENSDGSFERDKYHAREERIAKFGERDICVFCGKHKLSHACRTVPLLKDRLMKVRNMGLCTACLLPGGTAHQCSPTCSFCMEKHHLSLCAEFMEMFQAKARQPFPKKKGPPPQSHPFPKRRNERAQERPRVVGVLQEEQQVVNASNTSSFVKLQTGQLMIQNGSRSRKVDFLLDSGSSVSLISNSLAKEMQLKKVEEVRSSLTGIGGSSTGVKLYPIFHVSLRGTHGREMIVKAMGYDEPLIESLESSPLPAEDVALIQNRRLTMADEIVRSIPVQPRILIGGKDYTHAISWKKAPIPLPSGLALIPSVFGWLVTGETNLTVHRSLLVAHLSERRDEQRTLNLSIQSFLALEDSVNPIEVSEKAEDEKVMKFFNSNVERVGGHIQAKYCIKDGMETKLSANDKSSVARLRNVVLSLKRHGKLDHYDSVIREYMAKGYVENALSSPEKSGPIVYLPHHAVYRLDKPQKPIRIVFDASAKERGKTSLNEAMYTGPITLERIPALIIRSRLAHSIILSDVESAFLQVGIHPEQRDLLRFLWLKDPQKPVSDANIMHCRFRVAPFGVAQSPFLLEAAIRYHVLELSKQQSNQDYCWVLKQLLQNLYVDNVLFECDSTVNKENVYRAAKNVFAGISMNLREFSSNDTSFVEAIPEIDRGKVGKQKVLGLQWCSVKDNFPLNVRIPEVEGGLTKRKVLQKLATPFDPMGWLTPLLLPAKVFVQRLWTKDYGWDTEMSPEDSSEWLSLEKDLERFSITLPRQIWRKKSHVHLMTFADASCKAMGAAIYLVDEDRSNLLLARSQLAPIKNKQTIPKLELRAVLLACQMLLFTVQSMKKSYADTTYRCRVHTDSEIALYWIANQINGSNRVAINTTRKITSLCKQICEEVHPKCAEPGKCITFDHVRSEENPADVASRGCTSQAIGSKDHIWWSGPDWLTEEGIKMRQIWNPESMPESERIEASSKDRRHQLLTTVVKDSMKQVVEIARFSKLERLRRTVAYVRRYLRMTFKNSPAVQKIAGDGPLQGVLTAKEVMDAEMCVAKLHQIAMTRQLTDRGNRLLELFQDKNGVYRCGHCRLSNSNLSYGEKFPIFLPGKSEDPLVKMIIRHAHAQAMHSGENHTLDKLRSKYWLPKARRAVQRVLRTCVPCRRSLAKPYVYPSAPELPEDRVRCIRPFQSIGIDFAGPFTTKDGKAPPSYDKMYVLLITCLSTRAVHIETTESLSSNSFFAAFRRFAARRGFPKQVISDNAPAFHAVNLFTKENENRSELFSSYLATNGISWKFTAPHAPWQGGIYERLVAIMKNCLKRTYGRKTLLKEEFTTVMAEVEAVMNSRPLIHLSNDLKDQERILRPSDFLSPGAALGTKLGNVPGEEDDGPGFLSSSANLKKQYESTERILQKYWDIFVESYLHSLRSRERASVKNQRVPDKKPKTGEVVLIANEDTPRGTWPLGHITEVGEHHASVFTGTGRILKRPYNLLVPLEVSSHEADFHNAALPEKSGDKPGGGQEARPIRNCKSLGRNQEFWRANL